MYINLFAKNDVNFFRYFLLCWSTYIKDIATSLLFLNFFFHLALQWLQSHELFSWNCFQMKYSFRFIYLFVFFCIAVLNMKHTLAFDVLVWIVDSHGEVVARYKTSAERKLVRFMYVKWVLNWKIVWKYGNLFHTAFLLWRFD